MDEFGSPIAGGLRGIRRSISSNIFTGRSVLPPQPDPQTTNLLSQNSLAISGVAVQLTNISEQVSTLNNSLGVLKSNLEISDQLDRQREAAKQKREATLAEQGLREGKESDLERKIQNALLSPVRRVAAKTQGILGRLAEFLFILASGWLTDKSLTFLRLQSEGNIDELKKFKEKFLRDLGVLAAIATTMVVGIGALVTSVGSIAGLAVKFAFSALLARPFTGALNFIRNNVNSFRKNFVKFAKKLVEEGPEALSKQGKKLLNAKTITSGAGITAGTTIAASQPGFRERIGNFFKSVTGKQVVTESLEGVSPKNSGLAAAKKATLSKSTLGLDALFAYLDFRGRKKEGQSNKEAGMGATGTALGSLAGFFIAMTLIPEPISSVIGGIGTGILAGLTGGVSGSLIGGKIADEASGLNERKREESKVSSENDKNVKPTNVDETLSYEPVDTKNASAITPTSKKDSKVSELISSFTESPNIQLIPLGNNDKQDTSAMANMATSSKTPSDYIPNIPSSDFANNFIGLSESMYNVVV